MLCWLSEESMRGQSEGGGGAQQEETEWGHAGGGGGKDDTGLGLDSVEDRMFSCG